MEKVLCWGSAQYGQLGIGPVDFSSVPKPQEVPLLNEKEIKIISCGVRHTLIVFKDGSIQSCGDNEYGQLGHQKSCTRPGTVDLQSQEVLKVAAGEAHSLALTSAREVFTWGCNSKGQLGRGDKLDEEQCRSPKLVKPLATFTIIQIACGHNHSLALSQDGSVFTWGDNSHGQLGLGTKVGHYSIPQFVNSIKGIPMAQVIAGGSHSFFLSISGTLFGCGKNSFGQLGVNDVQDHEYPTLCKTLRNQKVKYVSCGEDHTVTLTADGGVFTFGAGSYGQLGHGSTNNEILPKKVMELMGSTLTQVACGRRHTLTYVPSSAKVYSFGLNGNGQLAAGDTTNKNNPSPASCPFLPAREESMKIDGSEHSQYYHLRRLYSGGDHAFAITVSGKKDSTDAEDYRCIVHKNKSILKLSDEHISAISNLSCDIPLLDFSDEVSTIFSSPSCLNCSFLKKNDCHFETSSKNHGVDMENVRESFQTISQSKNVIIKQKISSAVESLLPTLPTSPPDIEALRLYLILPELHFFDEPKYLNSIIGPFGSSVLHLDRPASRVLDHWWSTLQFKYFSRIVYVYKECVIYLLQLPPVTNPTENEMRKRGMWISMEMLKKLNIVNEQGHPIIPYNHFYINGLADKVDLRQDYINWIIPAEQRAKSSDFMFCNYPFVFDAAAKSILLQTDDVLQMQMAMRISMPFRFPLDIVQPCLIIYVSRDNLVTDTMHQLSKYGPGDLKKPLKVIFIGEEAVDAGGVTKEFFLLLLREILSPNYGMFKSYEESRLIWFNHQSFEERVMFHLIGVLCGLAIYNMTIINLNFPLALYKKLLRKPVLLADLEELMPGVGRSLQSLLEYPDNDVEETFLLTFEIMEESFGEVKTVELVEGGSSKPVNISNRQEYVDAYVNYVFETSVKSYYDAFSSGFLKVIGGRVLELFHPQELQSLVVGNENYDFHELEKNTEYKAQYHRYHPTIMAFWDVFHDLPLESKKKYLLFLTGSDRIPIQGMKDVKTYIQPTGGGDAFLPVAHTCFNLLDLPMYSSKQKLKEKLLIAIEQTEGFGLV